VGEKPGRVEDSDSSPEQDIAVLESEIAETRKKLGSYISEFDRRRHEILKTGPRRAGLIVAAGALLVVGTALVILPRRRRGSPGGKAERFAGAIANRSAKRRRAAPEQKSFGRKILVAAATAAAAQLARNLSARALSSSS
jgi:LPXTG-motif cell wall-anchored protein